MTEEKKRKRQGQEQTLVLSVKQINCYNDSYVPGSPSLTRARATSRAAQWREVHTGDPPYPCLSCGPGHLTAWMQAINLAGQPGRLVRAGTDPRRTSLASVAPRALYHSSCCSRQAGRCAEGMALWPPARTQRRSPCASHAARARSGCLPPLPDAARPDRTGNAQAGSAGPFAGKILVLLL